MTAQPPQPLVTISRVETFAAAHRLHAKGLSDEENKRIFGKCNHAHGHGHNYKVEVYVSGPVDEVTGMVLNVTDLKHCMAKAFLEDMDHKNLDVDVPFFQHHTSTGENIAVYIWQRMQALLPSYCAHARLVKVKLHETEKNVITYKGQ